ncbi:retrovirus-related pol polyprotein from transposon TNT 1-94 [Tanacetum coccineum]
MSTYTSCCLQTPLQRSPRLWHRRLNHLNFGTLNELARNNLVRGLPLLKYDKDHLCPSCQLGKSKKASHPLKAENTNTEVLHTLHMDLCGPMRTESINGKNSTGSNGPEAVALRVILLIYLLDASRYCTRKRPKPTNVPPTNKQEDDLFQWFDDDGGLFLIPLVCSDILPVNFPAAPAPENANGSPSTTIMLNSNVFDTITAPKPIQKHPHTNSVNIDVTPNNQLPHVQKWTQAHPLENIIGDKDRPVSTRKQLETDAMWCFFNEFLTHVEPKTYKQALEHSCWIEAMQEEIHEKLSWMNMRRLKETKLVLVAKGYHQELVWDFEESLSPFARIRNDQTLLCSRIEYGTGHLQIKRWTESRLPQREREEVVSV